ncbi:hypothetical protein VKI21_06795 [Cyanobacterium aponinum UTEX 3222]|uniref:hypothetical protein n=1 Tax=Cyanobacterium aponinum TaxID=379064 RepID=UPI002B4BB905|nr:hypothetical protein [Cyanobacterium aponinum]WRL37049.1 hypothetical protein VKI22_10445 [Cyanobacterium aponinum UTEX 3221]WRL43384.1 hypothetical protein VKI21_06795 [Cyanobacterium aponinum UTEX 3222]
MLVKSEWLHFSLALFFLVGMAFFWWRSTLLAFAFVLGLFHYFEHLSLLKQAMTHQYWFGATKPMTYFELFIPRIELHFIYNVVITIIFVAGLYQLKGGINGFNRS